MTILTDILSPLLKGNVAKAPARMKQAQNLLSLATAGAALVVAFVPSLQPYLNEDIILKAFAAYSAVNLYFTTASTDKIGL